MKFLNEYNKRKMNRSNIVINEMMGQSISTDQTTTFQRKIDQSRGLVISTVNITKSFY